MSWAIAPVTNETLKQTKDVNENGETKDVNKNGDKSENKREESVMVAQKED